MTTRKPSGAMCPEEINRDRRRFFGTTAVTIAASRLGMNGTADAQPVQSSPGRVPAIRPGTNTSFAPLKQTDAGVLNVGYAEAGPAAGPPIILLHGWPYDIYSFVDVAPLLASAGYRVIVPYLRGYLAHQAEQARAAEAGRWKAISASIDMDAAGPIPALPPA